MPYTAEQIGEINVRPISSRAKDRFLLVLIQHGAASGVDETQITIAAPISWHEGRTRSLRLIAAGVDLNDIRCAVARDDGTSDGVAMRTAQDALWWTAGDAYQSELLGLTINEYAAALYEKRQKAVTQ